jgi:hypothetical protein
MSPGSPSFAERWDETIQYFDLNLIPFSLKGHNRHDRQA